MSVPVDHHYLPQFYLSRWADNKKVYRFVRPLGVGGQLHRKRVSPKAIGYEKGLYTIGPTDDPLTANRLELEFLQKIDSGAATALAKLDRDQPASLEDRTIFAQFLISLLHRSPSRLVWMEQELRKRIASTGLDISKEPDEWFRDASREVFADLVSSDWSLRIFQNFRIFRVDVADSRHTLLTSDKPTMMSNGLLDAAGFLMVPIGPRQLLIVTKEERVADAFSSQRPNALVSAVNDAVVRQADSVVIASDPKHESFIDKRFLLEKRGFEDSIADDGLPRWKVP